MKLSIPQAKRNNEIISLSDSEVLRFIDEFNGITDADEKSKIIKKEIKLIKKKPVSIENKNNIKSLYEQLHKLHFKSDYVCIIMDNMSDFNRANKGFIINGMTYKRFLGTTNGVKKSTIIYINQEILEKLNKRIDNGRNLNVEIVPAKLEAYKSLACSSSIPVSNPIGVLVVKDCETTFRSDIINLDDTDSKEPKMQFIKNHEIILNESDGYGLISKTISDMWSKELGEDYIAAGYCIRNSFCKGMVFTFDFHDFSKKIAKNNIVTDAWGNTYDINNINLILTTSMLKLWDSYNSVEDYLYNCKNNKYNFSITKICPKELENERNLNYQFLQTYKLSDEQINELIQPTISEFHEVLSGDVNKTILFSKGVLNEDNIKYIEDDFIKALMIDNYMIHDPYVYSRIYQMIHKRINEAKVGVIKVAANFSIVSGDPYSLCQSIFNIPVTGLLSKGKFYSKYWNDKGVDEVVCFRAPMTCHNNIRILQLHNTEDMQYWYRYMDTVTIFNSWDTTSHALNGLDKDSDSVLTTNNSILLSATRELPSIICVQKKAKKVIVTEDDLVRANKNSFGDDIGSTTNRITSMIDVQSKFSEDTVEYNILDYRIKCGQLYQQNAIDKTKGIISNPMPTSWYDRKANKILDTDDADAKIKKQLNLSILADKKPYFMCYIYPKEMHNYKTYIDKTNRKSLRVFRISMKDLLEKENKLKNEKEFLKYYKDRMPVGLNNSLINKICWIFEKEFDGFVTKQISETVFDYSILKSSVDYSKNNYNKIKELYKQYCNVVQTYKQSATRERIDEDESSTHKSLLKLNFKEECLKICNNEDELCNIVLDICYTRNVSKQFAWDISGDIIIKNLLNINHNKLTFPKLDDQGDITYCGFKYSTCFVQVGEDS